MIHILDSSLESRYHLLQEGRPVSAIVKVRPTGYISPDHREREGAYMEDARKSKVALIEELRRLRAKVRMLERSKGSMAARGIRKAKPKKQNVVSRSGDTNSPFGADARYHALFEKSGEAILLTQPDGTIHSANPEACRMFGRSEEELKEIGRAGVVDPKDPRLLLALEERRVTGKFKGELRLLRKDGHSFPAEVSSTIFNDSQGNERTIMIIRDIIERQQMEEQLRQVKVQYQQLVENINEVIFSLDDSGTITYVSPAVSELGGYIPAELSGRSFSDVIFPEDVTIARSGFERVIRGELGPSEFRILTKPGDVRWVRSSSRPIVREGKVVGISGSLMDITERKRAEEAVALLAHAIRSISECVSVTDQENKILFVNDAFLKTYGYTRDELLGKPISIVRSTTSEPAADDVLLATLRGGWQGELVNRKKDGTEFPITLSTSIVCNDKGRVLALVGIAADITERKWAEEDLKRTLEWQEAIFEGTRDAVFIVDFQDRFVAVNIAACHLTGYTRDELLKMRIPDLHEEEDLAAYNKFRDRIMAGDPILSEARIRRKDGLKVDTEFSNSRVFIAGIPYMHTTARDITERKRAQEALHESEERITKAFCAIPDALIISRLEDGKILEVNDSWYKVFGYSREEVIGKSSLALDLFADSADRQRAIALLLKQGFVRDFELQIRQKSGALRTVVLSIELLEIHGEQYMISVVQDITERKMTEESLAESERKLKTLFEILPVGASILNAQRKIVYVNPALERILDISKESLFKGDYGSRTYLRPDGTLMPAEEFASVRAIKEQRAVHSVETGVVKEDGTIIWISVSAVALGFPDWDVLVVSSDITERKRAEIEMNRQRETLQKVFDHIPVMITYFDETGDIKMVNQELVRKLGWTFEEWKTENILAKSYPESEALKEALDFMVSKRSGWKDFKTTTKSGTAIDTMWTNILLPDGVSIGIGQDITERKRAEEALHVSLEKYRVLFESFPLGITITDKSGKIMEVNRQSERLLGITRDAHTQRSIDSKDWQIIRKDGTSMPVDEFASTRALQENRLIENVEMGIVKDKGKITWINVTAAPIPLEDYGVAIVYSDLTDRRLAEERLRRTQEQLRLLAAHLENVREEERKHLSQEFHDQVGQILTAIKIDLSMLQRTVADSRKELSRSVISLDIVSMHGMIDRAIAIIREIMSELRPELLDELGIVPTLEYEVERFQRHSGISCTFRSAAGEIALDAKKSIAMYRIFQEAIANVARHAKATSVEISLRKEGADLVLEIKDNGIGISADAENEARSFGLIGMRERAILLGGTLEIGGVERKGTTVLVRIPYEHTLTDGGVAL